LIEAIFFNLLKGIIALFALIFIGIPSWIWDRLRKPKSTAKMETKTEKGKEERPGITEERKRGWGWLVLLGILLLAAGIILLGGFSLFVRPGIPTLPEIPLWVVGVVIIILLFLSIVRFTTVDEGTAKIIMRWGGIQKVFIQWEGYELNPEGKVIETGKPKPWYKGLRAWIGLPVDKVYEYNLRFHSVEEIEGKRKAVFHEKRVNCVQIRPDRYWRKSLKMETKDDQFPDVEWLIGMRSIIPQKTIFKAPHNWVENALTELEPTLRSYARTKTLTELLNLTRAQIWAENEMDPAIQAVLKDEWGIQIDSQEIGIFDASPPPGYQEALAVRSKREMEAKGTAAETVGVAMEMMAIAKGEQGEKLKDGKNVPKESKKETKSAKIDQELQEKIFEKGWDFYLRKMEAERGALVDIRTEGGADEGKDTLKNTIMDFIVAAIRTPKGISTEGKKQAKRRGKPKKVQAFGVEVEVREEEEEEEEESQTPT